MADQPRSKRLVFLHGEIKTPPFSAAARIEAGELLRSVLEGEPLSMPHSRPMPSIGAGCHELRIRDVNKIWRVVYRIDSDVIPVAEVFQKTTNKTPKEVIDTCAKRFRAYDEERKRAEKKVGEEGGKASRKRS